MRRIMTLLAILFTILVVLTLCNKESDNRLTWESTVDEAIKKEFNRVGFGEIQRFKYEESIYILFRDNDLNNAYGVAKVETSSKGYRLDNTMGPVISPYVQLSDKTELGTELDIIAGNVYNKDVKKVRLVGTNKTYELEVFDGYYLGFNIPKGDYKVISVKAK
ncbi:hypothetical protein [Paenibacillus caui]|uniref:hypothetical protein n=1 Tax=Paenibacillus caui TaxID=2873927 RepID=UPI001CA838EA|nr:hypothetical protein [Paenibacillus caui]